MSNNDTTNKEQLCTITEQGSYGLGANEVDEKEREELKKRLQEQLNQSK